jgi:Flp pilus assembly protein CpaB
MIKAPIERGTPFEAAEAAIVETTIPAEYRPDTYVINKAELANKVAITDLPANSVLVQNMFVNSDVAVTTFRDRLTDPTMVAIALPIDGVRGLSGYLRGGDLVNIMIAPAESIEVANDLEGSGRLDPMRSPFSKSVRYLYQKVEVLAVGQDVALQAGEAVKESDGTAESPTLGGAVVVKVPAAVAQRLAAIDPADFYLTLVSDEWTPTPIPPMAQDELDGTKPTAAEDAAILTPYGPNGSIAN